MTWYILNQYRNNIKNITIHQLSVTFDIHFKTRMDKEVFFDSISTIQHEGYKQFKVQDETLFYYPWDFQKDCYTKRRPKIRFYDKQKDIKHRYMQKLKKVRAFDFADDDKEESRIFKNIDLESHKETLQEDFLKGYSFVNNTIRFEIDFNSVNLYLEFEELKLSKLNLNNMEIVNNYLGKLLDLETVSFEETLYYDQVTKERVVSKIRNCQIDTIDSSGDLTERFNLIIKHHKFLNNINYHLVGMHKQDTEMQMSSNALYSKIKRFRERGIISGRGKDVHLNEPYLSLLKLFNKYQTYDYFKLEQKNSECRSRSGRLLMR